MTSAAEFLPAKHTLKALDEREGELAGLVADLEGVGEASRGVPR